MIALPCLLYSMDLTVLHLAVPQLSADLRPTGVQLLWIVDVYGFLVAGSLVTMGTLGDRIGRRRLLLVGAAFFSVTSLIAAFASTAEENGRDPQVAAAMVDTRIEIEGLVTDEELLTLTVSQALEFGYAEGVGAPNTLITFAPTPATHVRISLTKESENGIPWNVQSLRLYELPRSR